MAGDPYKDKERSSPIEKTEEIIKEVIETIEGSECECIPHAPDCSYAEFINPYYATPERMQKNISILENAISTLVTAGLALPFPGKPLAHIKWGYYQPILIPKICWPGQFWDPWGVSVDKARVSLDTVPNNLPVCPAEPSNIPTTKLKLLDALVQKCFNSPPSGHVKDGIPMVIQVTQKAATDPDSDKNDIAFTWETAPDGALIKLHLTMICPYIPPSR